MSYNLKSSSKKEKSMNQENEDLTAEKIERLTTVEIQKRISEGRGCSARLLATGYHNVLCDWLESEVKRGTDCGDILTALMTENTSMAAEQITFFYKAEAAREVAQDLGETFTKALQILVAGIVKGLNSGELKHPADW